MSAPENSTLEPIEPDQRKRKFRGLGCIFFVCACGFVIACTGVYMGWKARHLFPFTYERDGYTPIVAKGDVANIEAAPKTDTYVLSRSIIYTAPKTNHRLVLIGGESTEIHAGVFHQNVRVVSPVVRIKPGTKFLADAEIITSHLDDTGVVYEGEREVRKRF